MFGTGVLKGNQKYPEENSSFFFGAHVIIDTYLRAIKRDIKSINID